MTLEQQVCTIQLAKKLKELGAKQESHFVWISTPLIEKQLMTAVSASIHKRKEPERFTLYAAFTVAELGKMLPMFYFTNRTWTSYPKYQWYCTSKDTNYIQRADTEADARAKMLIYLIDHLLVKN